MTLIAKKTISFVQRNNKLFKLLLWSTTLVVLVYMLTDKQASFSLQLSPSLWIKVVGMLSVTAFCNWWVETVKWRHILRPMTVSWGKAWASVLQGLAVGFLTPNRVGEFAGRMKVFARDQRWMVTARSWQSSMHQALVTWSAMWVALGYVTDLLVWGVVLILLFNIICITLFNKTNGSFLKRLLLWLNKEKEEVNWFSTPFIQWQVYSLSVLRYVIFLGQYTFVLLALGMEVEVPMIMALVALQFTIMHFVPNIGLAELGVREVIAVVLFNWVSDASGTVALGTFLVWIFNLFIPTLIGVFLGAKNDLKS